MLKYGLLVAAILAAMPGILLAGITYSGSLTASGGGICGLGPWDSPVTTISWTVTQLDGGLWSYSYLFTVPQKGISHFDLEAAYNLDEMNSGTMYSLNGKPWVGFELDHDILKVYYPNPGSPNMPAELEGFKFDVPSDSLSLALTFQTPLGPVWGDFYAKGGKDSHAKITAEAFNCGFTADDADPAAPPCSGSVEFHLLVPGPAVVPEPVTMCVIAAGGVWVACRRRRTA